MNLKRFILACIAFIKICLLRSLKITHATIGQRGEHQIKVTQVPGSVLTGKIFCYVLLLNFLFLRSKASYANIAITFNLRYFVKKLDQANHLDTVFKVYIHHNKTLISDAIMFTFISQKKLLSRNISNKGHIYYLEFHVKLWQW